MEPPQFTGGIRIALGSFGPLNASYPFARLTINEHSVRITIDFESTFAKIVFVAYIFGKIFGLNRVFDIPFDTINVTEKYRGILSTGVRIRHHARAPEYIVFWSTSWQEILRLLAERGVPVKSAA